jgi:Protein of unknown function (DUF2568)
MSTTARRLSPAQLALLILRVTMEIGVVVALAYWGVHVASSTGLAVVLGIGAPLVGFGIWGTVDFHQAGRHAEWLRLAEELTITLLAAAALYQTGQPAAGVALATLSIIYHTLVYATGTTLLDS